MLESKAVSESWRTPRRPFLPGLCKQPVFGAILCPKRYAEVS